MPTKQPQASVESTALHWDWGHHITVTSLLPVDALLFLPL
jgi:hypothetical protein